MILYIAILLLVSTQGLCSLIVAYGTDCKRYSFSNRPSQDCSNLDLKFLPALFSDVISLNLANNSFPVIQSLPQNYSRLVNLRMDHCKIEKISMQALSALQNLKSLDLSHNRLTSFLISSENRALTTLNLAHNKLKYLPDLSHLHRLRLLDLSHNRLISIQPQLFPVNLESIRLTGNQITHLAPIPFLHKLQELDVSFNPLKCECPLWTFITWAEGLALFDSSSFPCHKPPTLRKTQNGEFHCGPEVTRSDRWETSIVSIGTSHKMCCTVASEPAPIIRWVHNGNNMTKRFSFRHIPESRQGKYCMEIESVTIDDLGKYQCIASLEGYEESKEFILARDISSIILTTDENIFFYVKISAATIFIIFFCGFCCCLKSSCRKKRRHFKNYAYPQPPHLSQYPENLITEDSSVNSNDACILANSNSEWTKVQLGIWRNRIGVVPAPLAEFDQDTHLMPMMQSHV